MRLWKFTYQWIIPIVVISIWVYAMLKLFDPFMMLVGFDSAAFTGGITWCCWWYNKQPKKPLSTDWYTKPY